MESIKLNLIPSGVNPTCHCSQYDEGRIIRIDLFDGLTPYALQSGDAVTLNVRKPDNTIITTSITATAGNNYVEISTTEQMCAVVGFNLCDLTITNGSKVIGTLNFIMAIERDVLADGIPSQSVIEDLEELVQEAVGDNYYTKDQTYNKSEVDAALALKANSADVYTKSETYDKMNIDLKLSLKADKVDTYNKSAVDNLLDAKADKSTTYTKVQVDTMLETKAEIDGDYPLMTVGNAEQLKSNVGEINKTPYLFRTSGGSIDIGGSEVDKIVGGTVAFNQLVNYADITSETVNNVTFTNSNGVITITTDGTASNVVYKKICSPLHNSAGHKLLIICSNNTVDGLSFFDSSSPRQFNEVNTNKIISASGADISFYCRVNSGATVNTKISPLAFDLTQMFGSTIADYIYSLEQGTAGAGVAYFRKLFPKSYYAYNAGELMSVKTSAHNMTGFNQWDEQWELGSIDDSTGSDTTANNVIRSKNFIPVVNNLVYYINSSNSTMRLFFYDEDKNYISYVDKSNSTVAMLSNAHYIKFRMYAAYGTTYKNDICINLSWDGERNGEYEPYELNSYELDPDLELRGIPKLDANNNLYYDGDEYESDGTVTRKYQKRSYQEGDVTDGLTMITDGTNTVVVLATPTTEQADPYTNPQVVNDFGTEEYVDTRSVAIPVGHDTFYQANLRAKLEMAPDAPENNGDYLMRHNNGENTYIPYSSPIPTPPTTDGTYTLKVTVSGGVASYSWVSV